MAVISELIRSEADGSISFGDYTLADKKKLEDYKHDGDLYKVKTFSDITKLEKNGMFVYESVPGTAVEKFNCTSDSVSFTVEGKEDAMITLELEPETDYDITVGGNSAGQMRTNLGGKLNLSVELDPGTAVEVQVKKA
ncbi:MAG: endosialidase [Pseudobutyrivibrio sp.]|nr:endosialidase [Pseudobutyrivibrio sp.]